MTRLATAHKRARAQRRREARRRQAEQTTRFLSASDESVIWAQGVADALRGMMRALEDFAYENRERLARALGRP